MADRSPASGAVRSGGAAAGTASLNIVSMRWRKATLCAATKEQVIMNRMMSGLNRLVRGIACVGIALVVAMTVTSSTQAQTPVVPAGGGHPGEPHPVCDLGGFGWGSG